MSAPRHLLALVAATCVGSAVSLPAGFSTYFETDECPPGWFPDPSARGRLIVSVADAATGGVTVGEPLAAEEDRHHTHAYDAALTLPSKHVSAIGCCNKQGAEHGQYSASGSAGAASSGLPMVQLLLCQLKEDSEDTVAFGTVAYFDSRLETCPANWKPLVGAAGRAIVPGYAGNGTTTSSSAALQSGEDRQHSHAFSIAVNVPDVSYAGIDGCCNDGPAPSGTYTLSSALENASTGLPYIQLLTCVSSIPSFSTSMPDGSLLFNQVACPPGMNASLEAAGRFPVALPVGGVPGATVGGDSLPPGSTSDISHAHQMNGTVTSSSCGVGLASGCCASGYAETGTYVYEGESEAEPCDFPYLMMPLCSSLSR